ncbi:hypothetical protein PROFUN_09283 [Planoprotostelium fungivorum]|uniref:BTB domain-containing protein n=1 Tax=Planoprotostelium fungivorum TaxID=1890364 RepID=A0A2P6NKX4_9EUKA|nr:hypothetical protein PROFUN_09283 [Planoprotostelium fungivorum]
MTGPPSRPVSLEPPVGAPWDPAGQTSPCNSRPLSLVSNSSDDRPIELTNDIQGSTLSIGVQSDNSDSSSPPSNSQSISIVNHSNQSQSTQITQTSPSSGGSGKSLSQPVWIQPQKPSSRVQTPISSPMVPHISPPNSPAPRLSVGSRRSQLFPNIGVTNPPNPPAAPPSDRRYTLPGILESSNAPGKPQNSFNSYGPNRSGASSPPNSRSTQRANMVQPLFRNGFGDFLSDGMFSDLILHHQRACYHVHQIILAHSSEYFALTLRKTPVLQTDHTKLENLVKRRSLGLMSPSTITPTPSLTSSVGENSPTSLDVIALDDLMKEKGLVSDAESPSSMSPIHTPEEKEETERSKKVIKLSFPDPENVFPLVLDYIYKGTITLRESNAIAVLKMAAFLGIEELKGQVSGFLLKNIVRDNVLENFQRALNYHAEEVIEKCILVVAKNFSSLFTMHGPSFINFLPYAYAVQLLNHTSLAVFETVVTYLNHSKELLSSQYDGSTTEEEPSMKNSRGFLVPYSVRKSLFECVRLPSMDYEELQRASQEALLPKAILLEALMIRIASHECPEKAKTQQKRLQKRAPYGFQFEYKTDLEGGVLYWIGTKGGTGKWRNPCVLDNGIVIHASSLNKGNPFDIADYIKPKDIWTDDVPSSWYCVDLGASRSLLPTYYTLRHGGSSRQDCLRNWVLQASDDMIRWHVLLRHRDEKVLDSNYATYSWPISSATKPFRYFRILQTGHNSSNHNFLSLSGIEFYGELYDQMEWLSK